MKPGPLRYLTLLVTFLVMIWSTCLPTVASQANEPDLVETANVISRLIAENHYNPAELKRPEYLTIEKRVMQAAISAKSNDEFMRLFKDLWRDGPFSHVNLVKSDLDAAARADFFDTFRVGGGGAMLAWQKDVAVLTVNTMMGLDTIEEINEAYAEIVNKAATALIIDLRNNEGGAFAIVPLVSHLLNKPLDAGIFASRKWNADKQTEPTLNDVASLDPWTGWSIKSFWHDVQTAPLTRVQFIPMAPQYLGPVYILTSQRSASATEFAIDALANLTQVTIIGEPTAGKMLSQKMFDVPNGLLLALPIAEYYSTRIGRIEGKGVSPTIAVSANQAMDVAMGIIAGADPTMLVKKLAASPKQVPSSFSTEKLYLFGSMNNWGKSWSNTPKFQYQGEGIYEAKVKFKKGSWEFKVAPMNWSIDLGAMDGDETILEGKTKSLIKKKGSHNLIITVNEEVDFIVRLDVNDEHNPKLRFDKM